MVLAPEQSEICCVGGCGSMATTGTGLWPSSLRLPNEWKVEGSSFIDVKLPPFEDVESVKSIQSYRIWRGWDGMGGGGDEPVNT